MKEKKESKVRIFANNAYAVKNCVGYKQKPCNTYCNQLHYRLCGMDFYEHILPALCYRCNRK